MTIKQITIADIGNLFAKNGYILSTYGIMQYDTYTDKFDYVQDNEVLDIFRRLYPNFERRVLKVGMIEEYLPKISDNEFHIYDLCKKVEVYNLDEGKLNQEIKKIVDYNENRKRDLPDLIPGNDYDSCIQYLINNDIYTDCTILYKYSNGYFEPYTHLNMPKLFRDVISDKMDMDKYLRIVYIGLNELTYINDIKEDLDMRNLSNSISNEDWRTYERITDIIKGVKQNDQ